MKVCVLVGALALLASACGTRYEVVHQSARSPIGANHEIVLRAPTAGAITVNGHPESSFTSSLSPGERQAWIALLDVTRRAILEGLMEHRSGLRIAAGGPAPAVQIELKAVDLAHQDPRSLPKTNVRAILQILTPDGTVADEVNLTSVIDAEVVSEDSLAATRARRLRRAGMDLGTQAAAYIRERAGIAN